MAHADEIHPCTIWSTLPGRWLALRCEPWEVLDIRLPDAVVGQGLTADEALADLAHQLQEAKR